MSRQLRLGGIGVAHGYRGPTVCRITDVTYRQLDYWTRTGLITPSVQAATGSGTQRLCAFPDVVTIRMVKQLLDTGVSPATHAHRRGRAVRPRP